MLRCNSEGSVWVMVICYFTDVGNCDAFFSSSESDGIFLVESSYCLVEEGRMGIG